MTHQNLAFLTYEDKKDKIYLDRDTILFLLQQFEKVLPIIRISCRAYLYSKYFLRIFL